MLESHSEKEIKLLLEFKSGRYLGMREDSAGKWR